MKAKTRRQRRRQRRRNRAAIGGQFTIGPAIHFDSVEDMLASMAEAAGLVDENLGGGLA